MIGTHYEPYWSNYLKQFDLPASYFQNITRNTNKFCVIVEPRISNELILVIKNFMYLLQNKGWGLIVFHGTKNEEFIKKGLEGWPNIIFENLNCENLTINDYNDLMCSKEFYLKLKIRGCEHCLIFQTDTLLFKDNIDDYLKYDYVGAPWNYKLYGGVEVGNGGLSLRNVNKMFEIAESCTRNVRKKGFSIIKKVKQLNEDLYFSYWSHIKNFNIPSIDVAKTFSVEFIYYHDPCGFHKPWSGVFKNKEDFINILSKRFQIH